MLPDLVAKNREVREASEENAKKENRSEIKPLESQRAERSAKIFFRKWKKNLTVQIPISIDSQ